MAAQTPQQGKGGTESSGMTGASSNIPPSETQTQHRHHSVHRDAANATTGNMPLEATLNIVCKTGSCENRKQCAIGCKCRHIELHGHQLQIYHTAGVHRELHDRFTAATNGKPQWWTKAIVCTVRKIEHHDVVCSGMFVDKSSDKNPREGTKQALTMIEDGTEVYMVEVMAESNM